MNAPTSLDEIRHEDERALFPARLLADCKDALVLFAAGFHGRQDGYWIADAGIRAVCVDVDGQKLAEMEAVYPEDWQFRTADCFEYARDHPAMFDLVTVDCHSGLSERCMDELELWLGLARRACIVTVHRGMRLHRPPYMRSGRWPKGWRQTGLVWRSSFRGGCYWLVLERT